MEGPDELRIGVAQYRKIVERSRLEIEENEAVKQFQLGAWLHSDNVNIPQTCLGIENNNWEGLPQPRATPESHGWK